MLTATSGFKTNIKSVACYSNAKFDLINTSGTTSFDNDDIIRLEIFGSALQNGKVLGNLAQHSLTIEVHGDISSSVDLSLENRIEVYVGVLVSSAYEYIEQQSFIVTEVSYSDTTNITKILATDYLVKLNKEFIETNVYPMTLKAYLESVLTYCGLSLQNTTFLNSAFSVSSRPFIDYTNCKEIVSKVAELALCYVVINKTNDKVELRSAFDKFATHEDLSALTHTQLSAYTHAELTNVDTADVETLTKDNYFTVKFNDHNFGTLGVNTLVLKISQVDGENTTVENATNVAIDGAIEVVIEDNDFINTQALRESVIEDMFTVVDGYKFFPYTLEYRGFPYLELGDIFTLEKMDNTNVSLPIYETNIKYNGGLNGQLSAKTLNKSQTSNKYISSSKQRVRKTEIRVDKVEGDISLITSDVSGLDDIVNGVTANEAGLTLTPTAITSTVTSSTTYTTDLGGKEATIFKQASAPASPTTGTMWLETDVTPNVWYRWNGSAWVKATPTQASEVDAYSQSEIDTTLLSYSTITQTANDITLAVGTKEDAFYKQLLQPLYNIVANGDMASGTTGYVAVNSTLSANNNVLSVIGNTSGVYPQFYKHELSAVAVGHKMYYKATVRVTNSSCLLMGINIDGSASGTNVFVVSQANPVINTWYELSGVATQASDATGVFKHLIYNQYATTAIANGKVMEVKNMIAIDLTNTYGAGNEPTKAVMDVRTKQLWLDTTTNTTKTFTGGGWVPSSQLSGAKYVFDGTNATFTGGGLIIKNNAGTTVMTADTNGDIQVTGEMMVGKTSVNAGLSGSGTASTSIRIWAGYATPSTSADFYVRDDGYMKAVKGVIGGWTIASGSLSSGNVKLDSANSRIYLNSGAYFYTGTGTTNIFTSGNLTVGGGFYGTNGQIVSLANTVRMTFGATTYLITRDTNGFLKATTTV